PGGWSPGFQAGWARFYPLHIGNRWTYAGETSLQVLPNGAPPEPPYVASYTLVSTHTCLESFLGQSYVVERQTYTVGPQTNQTWVLYRQDFGGLFEADRVVGDAPACENGLGPIALPSARAAAADRAWSALVHIAPGPRAAAWQVAFARLKVKQMAIASALGTSGPFGGW